MPAPAKRTSAHRAAKSRPASRLGSLPEWNLSDLYAGIDDPQVKRDLDRGAAESLAFEQAYKGKLAMLADGPEAGAALAEAVKRYEALDDLLGRLTSYAGLLHAGDTVDPTRAKFYADVQERVTAEGHMPEDKFLVMSRKGKRLGVAYVSAPRGEGGAGSLKFKTK
jgi:oligoendopeptidase F